MADDQDNAQAPHADEPEGAEAQEPKEEFQCTVTVEDSGAWKKKIKVDILRPQIDKEFDDQYAQLRNTAEVPGFRKGRAPRRLIEKRYGRETADQTKLRLMARAFQKIEKDHDFEVLGEPDFDPEKIELPEQGDLTFEYEVEIKPQFELCELEGIQIEKPIFEITPERIGEAVDRLRRRAGRIEDVSAEPAQQDDMVTADVTMKVADVDEPEHIADCHIRVDSTAIRGVLIEDMAKTLEGAKVGDVKTCSADVPETHENADYRGKKAEFTIELKIIERLVLAELNQEFFDSLGVSDEAELNSRIERSLEDRTDREVRTMMEQQVREHFDKNVQFDLPAGVAARHADRMLRRRYYELLQQGIPQRDIDENIEKLRAASSSQSMRELKLSFIMEQVADKLELQVSDAEVNGYVAQLASATQRRPERLREEMSRQGRLDGVTEALREQKAIDKILETADVVDAPPPDAKPAAKTTKKKTRKKTAKKTSANDEEKEVKPEATSSDS